EKDVTKSAQSLTPSPVLTEFEQASQIAVREIRAYIDWLRKERLPKADASFALGRDGFRAMLHCERIDLSPEAILEIGLRELHAEQQRFAAAAAVIDPSQKPTDVYKAIQHEHPTAAELIPFTRKDLEAIRQFLTDHHIVSIPNSIRARVEETLPPFRST